VRLENQRQGQAAERLGIAPNTLRFRMEETRRAAALAHHPIHRPPDQQYGTAASRHATISVSPGVNPAKDRELVDDVHGDGQTKTLAMSLQPS
jgi:hypothetical protein